MLSNIVNSNIYSNISQIQSFKYYKLTTPLDIQIFYTIILYLENEWGGLNSSAVENYDVMRSKIVNMDNIMGHHRFKAINSMFYFSNDQIIQVCNFIEKQSQKLFEGNGPVSCDEQVCAYEPKPATIQKCQQQQMPIPVRHFPGKPHENGLLLYLLVGITSRRKPFILGLEPWTWDNQVSPREAMYRLSNRVKNAGFDIQVAADRAFGGMRSITTLSNDYGVRATTAVVQQENSYIWSVLDEGLEPGKGRCAAKVIAPGIHVTASVHCANMSTYLRVL